MRLLSTQKVQFIEVYGTDVPSYAILSHTWSDGEVLLKDLQDSVIQDASWLALSEQPTRSLGGDKLNGLKKILGSTKLALRNQYQYLWVDTCCIDKTSSAELSEAINSMYRWYAGADVCYVYLSDVPGAAIESPFEANSKFRRSRWFTRGWTLQELIASQDVVIFASDWTYLGAKTGDVSFTRLLSDITGVQLDVLYGQVSPQDMSIAARMHWAAHRQTTREEDVAYCLLGIFDVNMPLLYGEGKRSFIRLQEAILNREEDQSLFAWHSEPQPACAVGDQWQRSGFSGLLADSPVRFRNNDDIETAMPLSLARSPAAVTSKGLKVDFLLLPIARNEVVDGADFRVVLSCERLRQGRRESPVIFLKRIWGMGDQFARVRPDIKSFTAPDTSLLEDGINETVFVKQDPWSDMRTIRIVAAKDSSQLHLPGGMGRHRLTTDWKVKDVWPKYGWSESTEAFQTRELTFGLPCGILRLEIRESSELRTVDVAIGMHAPSERSCRSWCQIMNFDSFLNPESAFSWAMREAESGKINYNSLSTQDIHGADVSTWIVVTERNRKGRLDIALHVLSDKRYDGDYDTHREGYGQIIPLSTLPEEESKTQMRSLNHHPRYNLFTRMEVIWKTWQYEVGAFMGDICVFDDIEISVFPRISFGSKIRIRPNSKNTGPTALGNLQHYCLNALPAGDTETRRLAQILCGDDEHEHRSYLDASRILEGRSDSFLQLGPIHWAVIGDNTKIFRSLLDSGINVIGLSENRLTTLHLAFLLPRPGIVSWIWGYFYAADKEISTDEINENFYPTIKNEDYPIHFAAAYAATQEFWESFVPPLYSGPMVNRLGEEPIHRAAAMGNLTAVHGLLEFNTRPYSVNARDDQDRTPLWHAACSDYTGEITQSLLERGAHPNLTDKDGLAPIHVACREGIKACLKRLEAGGSNLNHPAGALCLLPTHFAAIFGRIECLQMLLTWQAQVVAAGADGPNVYALHQAIANGHEACARAIWHSLNPKPHYTGWSLCILLEAGGPVLKWMFLEVNEQHWFAIEDPWSGGGTQNFTCFSELHSTPKLWVRPGIPKHTSTDTPQSPVENVVQYGPWGLPPKSGHTAEHLLE
ncbi:hypothetical protein F5882DRAFT_380262 [Hyaloscypha sp. PMI_1271]|nr:hypothetical protein F5882DRAFT_380262 [Hyaloscypha sp. PMI_1271]